MQATSAPTVGSGEGSAGSRAFFFLARSLRPLRPLQPPRPRHARTRCDYSQPPASANGPVLTKRTHDGSEDEAVWLVMPAAAAAVAVARSWSCRRHHDVDVRGQTVTLNPQQENGKPRLRIQEPMPVCMHALATLPATISSASAFAEPALWPQPCTRICCCLPPSATPSGSVL